MSAIRPLERRPSTLPSMWFLPFMCFRLHTTPNTANLPEQSQTSRPVPETSISSACPLSICCHDSEDWTGSIVGLAAVTPRVTFSGRIVKNRIAFTQSFEYWFERDPVDSLPPLQSDTTRESFDSYTQLDSKISQRQTAKASFAIFPQRLDYFGLNTGGGWWDPAWWPFRFKTWAAGPARGRGRTEQHR
jgi:hypothetical protein